MDFIQVIVNRRSIRKFKEESVPEEALNTVLDAGRWAPSASNTQPWRFIVVTDASVKKRIADTCTEFSRKAWAKFSPERARYLAARGGSWDKSYMKKIPILIVVCYRCLKQMKKELLLGSTWAAIENMLLAATVVGLGSCIYTFYNVEEENRLKELLGVPEKYRVAAIIQLGYSAVNPPLPSRKLLKEIVSYQQF